MNSGFLDDLPDLDILRKRRRGWRESIPAESYFPKPRLVDYPLVRRKLFNALRNNEVRGELQAATKRVSEESGKYDEKLNWEEHRCLYIWTSNASRLVDDSDLLCCLLAVYYDGVCGLAKKVVADELKSMDQYVCECLISFIDQQKQAGIEILLACAEEKGLLKPAVQRKSKIRERQAADAEAPKILRKLLIPLSPKARLIYEKLSILKVHEAMTTPEILDWLSQEHQKDIDEGTLGKLLKEIKPYGLQNKPRIGYYIPKSS